MPWTCQDLAMILLRSGHDFAKLMPWSFKKSCKFLQNLCKILPQSCHDLSKNSVRSCHDCAKILPWSFKESCEIVARSCKILPWYRFCHDIDLAKVLPWSFKKSCTFLQDLCKILPCSCQDIARSILPWLLYIFPLSYTNTQKNHNFWIWEIINCIAIDRTINTYMYNKLMRAT